MRGDAKSVLYIIRSFTISKLLASFHSFSQMKEHDLKYNLITIPILGEIYLRVNVTFDFPYSSRRLPSHPFFTVGLNFFH